MVSSSRPSPNYTFLAGVLAYLFYIDFIGWRLKFMTLLLAWILAGGHYTLYLAYHTLGRDVRLAMRGFPIFFTMMKVKRKRLTVPKIFRRTLSKYPKRVMFFDEKNEMTYEQVEEFSNRVANMCLDKGYRKGDTVALFMENRIEYIPVWLGLAKVGVVPALINYNLRGDALLHCIQIAGSVALITSKELEAAVADVYPTLKASNSSRCFKVFCYEPSEYVPGPVSDAIDLKMEMEKHSPKPEPAELSEQMGPFDPLLYIYTSGTTGLPKAVVIKHFRQIFVMAVSHTAIGLSTEDVVYCHLPLYHSSGGQIATGSAIMHGSKTFIKKKFSASSFWKDCYKYQITVTQYIGEVCRYLLATPPVPEEKMHKVTKMFGNGLRPQVWREFTERFNIKDISEFFGSTEGNANIVNNENKVGAIGFIGVIEPDWLHNILLPLYLIKVDPATGDPIRDNRGFCMRCEPGEQGEFIGRIVSGDPLKEFNGYKDKAATDKKILTHVFRKGDRFFRSGDILVQDEFGWLYFQDRAGDTFRWKGENVSTTEVEVIISKLLDGMGVVAYGVQVPGTEGRAGMVCIQGTPDSVDFPRLVDGISNNLPSYARPLFFRFRDDLDMTGTYKLKKVKLQNEGYDIHQITDKIYLYDSKKDQVEPLTETIFQSIQIGTLRL